MTFAGPNFNGCHDKYRYAVQTPPWTVCAVCKTDVRCVCVQCLNSFAVPIACHRPQRVHIEQADRLLCSPVAQVPSSFSIQGELARPHLPLATPSRAHILTACVPLLAVTNLLQLHAWSSCRVGRQSGLQLRAALGVTIGYFSCQCDACEGDGCQRDAC